MARRLVWIAVIAVAFAVTWSFGMSVGSQIRSRLSQAEREPIGQVEVTVRSTDVPGCVAAGRPFVASVYSVWREKRARNDLVYRWEPAPGGADAIVVHVAGQSLTPTLSPGEPFPRVDLRLPLDSSTMKLTLTTFVFVEKNGEGEACFHWQRPPGTPQHYEVPRQDA